MEAANIKSPMIRVPGGTQPSRRTMACASMGLDHFDEAGRGARVQSLHVHDVENGGSRWRRTSGGSVETVDVAAPGLGGAGHGILDAEVARLGELDQQWEGSRRSGSCGSAGGRPSATGFEGEPPNMSVTTTTPEPSVDLVGGPRRSRGVRAARSSSGPTEMAIIAACLPIHMFRGPLELRRRARHGQRSRCRSPVCRLWPVRRAGRIDAALLHFPVTFRHRATPASARWVARDFGHRDRPVLPSRVHPKAMVRWLLGLRPGRPGSRSSAMSMTIFFFFFFFFLVVGGTRQSADRRRCSPAFRRGAAIMRLERRVPVRVAQKPQSNTRSAPVGNPRRFRRTRVTVTRNPPEPPRRRPSGAKQAA